jgi:hypothetical protein
MQAGRQMEKLIGAISLQILHEMAHKNQFGLTGFPQYTHFLREY